MNITTYGSFDKSGFRKMRLYAITKQNTMSFL